MSNDTAIKRIHKRIDEWIAEIKKLGTIIRGNGDSSIGIRGRMIEMSGRLDNVEQHIKDQKLWVRGIALLVIAQLVISVLK